MLLICKTNKTHQVKASSICKVRLIKHKSHKAVLCRKKWKKIRVTLSDSLFAKTQSSAVRCTGEFPVHQRCTSNRGLGAVCTSRRGRHPIFHFKRGPNFLREKMTACLPDCLRPRCWEEVVWGDIRELKVGGGEGAGGEYWQLSLSVSLSLSKSRKTGCMTLKILCESYKWRYTDSNDSWPTEEHWAKCKYFWSNYTLLMAHISSGD